MQAIAEMEAAIQRGEGSPEVQKKLGQLQRLERELRPFGFDRNVSLFLFETSQSTLLFAGV